jgi:hypothetical protein
MDTITKHFIAKRPEVDTLDACALAFNSHSVLRIYHHMVLFPSLGAPRIRHKTFLERSFSSHQQVVCGEAEGTDCCSSGFVTQRMRFIDSYIWLYRIDLVNTMTIVDEPKSRVMPCKVRRFPFSSLFCLKEPLPPRLIYIQAVNFPVAPSIKHRKANLGLRRNMSVLLTRPRTRQTAGIGGLWCLLFIVP